MKKILIEKLIIKSSIIQSEGIHTILMKHEDRSQTSLEEFEIVKKLMDQLIGSKFKDFDNSEEKYQLTIF